MVKIVYLGNHVRKGPTAKFWKKNFSPENVKKQEKIRKHRLTKKNARDNWSEKKQVTSHSHVFVLSLSLSLSQITFRTFSFNFHALKLPMFVRFLLSDCLRDKLKACAQKCKCEVTWSLLHRVSFCDNHLVLSVNVFVLS